MATERRGPLTAFAATAWSFVAAVFWAIVDTTPRFVGALVALTALLWVFLPGVRTRVIGIVAIVLAVTAIVGAEVSHAMVTAIADHVGED